MEIFSNIINVFTDTFDQFNASLMKSSLLISSKINLTPNFWMLIYLMPYMWVIYC